MGTFTGRLNHLEAELQDFIEDRFARFSQLRGRQDNMARRLVASLRAGTISTGDGILVAPDQFTILVHPSQVDSLNGDAVLWHDLANRLQEIGVEAGLHFGCHPVVTCSSRADIAIGKLEILSQISKRALGNTAELNSATADNAETIPPNAFLIINGIEVFILNQPVINIGRRSTNHLRIDDPRVSRQHAQMKAVHGCYEIIDLASTGGTFVNQKQITRSRLRAGDVISLAGVALIYGQERSASLDKKEKILAASSPDKTSAPS